MDNEPSPREPSASYARLRHLQSISDAALAHLRFSDLVEELLTRVTTILDVDTAAVLLLDEEAGELVARAAKGLEEEVEAKVRVPVGRGFAGRIAAERRVVAIPDLDQYDVWNPILRQKGLKSMLGAPLLVEGRVTGVVHVGTLTPHDFSDDEAELLQLVADRIAVAIDHSRLYEIERDTADQLRRLEAVTEAALAHLGLDDLLGVLLERIRDLIPSDLVVVMLVDDDGRELVTRATLGGEGDDAEGAAVAIGEGFAGHVAARGAPVVVEDVATSDVEAPALERHGLASMLGVPLLVAGELRGVLALGSRERRSFEERDVDLLQRAGDRIALAIENARLYDAERAARAQAEAAAERIRRIESIAEVALHHILVDDEILERLLTRVRDVLDVDTVAVLVADDLKQTLVSRAASGLEEEVERGLEVPIGRGFAGRVAAARAPVVVTDASQVEVWSPLLRRRVKSLAGVPLIVEERMLGVLHVGSRETREFSEEDVALLQLAGERLAVALDHSRLYERERIVAETLQRSLLPESLPSLPGAELASRYLPGEGEAVGGDWYDVVPLRDGRVALAMGDVVSRGLQAASVMGQLRNALRAYAIEDHSPASVLERVHVVSRGMEGRELATLAFVVLDPSSGAFVYSSAGHPPPLVVSAEGEVQLLEEGRGPPLGAIAEPGYTDARTVLERGDTLLLYTDGLVERRDMWIDDGIAALSEHVREVTGVAAEDLVEHVIRTLIGADSPEDDVAVLALRIDPVDARVLSLDLPAEPTVLAAMRQALRTWLAGVGARADDVYDILVATTEAAANAVEHAYGPGDATFQVKARAVGGDRVAVVVLDEGQWRPPRGHNRGRGTLLMQELMDDFEVVTGESGTEVRMGKQLVGTLAA